MYVSSDQGLFFTTNYSSVNLWDEFILPNEISTESVFDAEHLEFFDDIFIGTSQGICVYDGDSFSCESSSSDASESFYAYPNPLNFNETNQLTFVYNDDEININGEIVIYDIAMDRVAKINGVGISRWDGNNEFGDRVTNGLYICKYTHNNGDSHLFKDEPLYHAAPVKGTAAGEITFVGTQTNENNTIGGQHVAGKSNAAGSSHGIYINVNFETITGDEGSSIGWGSANNNASPTTPGAGAKYYKIYASWLYDNGSETKLKGVSGADNTDDQTVDSIKATTGESGEYQKMVIKI